ncbi:hypothetical protein [Amycolatopsis samaneae]|uniref:Secreted protein n=1 Tax=Amycolatopsis samaneae TaxID=664691 RepID=A0ABW5GVP6_9PSEU
MSKVSLKRTVIAGMLVGGAMVVAAGTASASPSTTTDHGRVDHRNHGGISVLNNACALPWLWNGPGNVGNIASGNQYSACNGNTSEGHHGIEVGNNLCVAPWLWNGPLNWLNPGSPNNYKACTGNKS